MIIITRVNILKDSPGYQHTSAGLQRNKMYVDECGYYDNGRLHTWLPYKRNQDSSALIHEISQEKLLGEQDDKYYAYWYSGPQVS